MNWKYKLTSRKFWVAIADFVAMLLVFLNYPQDKTTQIVALIMAGAAVVAYIVGEGLADCANALPATKNTVVATSAEKTEPTESEG